MNSATQKQTKPTFHASEEENAKESRLTKDTGSDPTLTESPSGAFNENATQQPTTDTKKDLDGAIDQLKQKITSMTQHLKATNRNVDQDAYLILLCNILNAAKRIERKASDHFKKKPGNNEAKEALATAATILQKTGITAKELETLTDKSDIEVCMAFLSNYVHHFTQKRPVAAIHSMLLSGFSAQIKQKLSPKKKTETPPPTTGAHPPPSSDIN